MQLIRAITYGLVGVLLLVGPGWAQDGESPDWRQMLNEKQQAPVDVQFEEILLRDAVTMLSLTHDLPIYLDPGAELGDVPVTLQMEQIQLGTALQLMAGNAGAEAAPKLGVLAISTPDRLAALPDDVPAPRRGAPRGHREALEALAGQTVTVDFPGVPFSDVIQFIWALGEVNLVLSPKLTDVEIQLKAKDLRMDRVLWLAAHQADAEVVFETNVLYVKPR